MLNNTIVVPKAFLSDSTSGNVLSLSLVDVDNGSSVRKYNISSTETIILKIQNLETKENPPVGSRRTQVRLEHQKVIEDGSTRVVACSVVITTPKSSDFTATEQLSPVGSMIYLLTGGDYTLAENDFVLDSGAWDSLTAGGSKFVSRLLTGEV
jgi:hypothetical protein